MTARHSFTLRLMAYMHDRPNQRIPSTRLFRFGACGWRSRLVEARHKLQAANDGTIEYQPTFIYRDGRRITLSGYPYIPKVSRSTKRKAA